MLVFEEGEKLENPEKKTLGARTRTNNKLNPHMTPGLGIIPGHIGGRRVPSPLRHLRSHFRNSSTGPQVKHFLQQSKLNEYGDLFQSFQLNSLTLGLHLQTQNFELHFKTDSGFDFRCERGNCKDISPFRYSIVQAV